MAQLLAAALESSGVTQAELARQAGVTLKHVNRVLNEQAAAQQGQLDYWAWLLGLRFDVKLIPTNEKPSGHGRQSGRTRDTGPARSRRRGDAPSGKSA